MFNGLFDVNVMVKLFSLVIALPNGQVILPRYCFAWLNACVSDVLALLNASWVTHIRHDEKLVTLAILFSLRPVGEILPNVWARQ